jgi:membrane associated rhomboid family serine protease
VFILPLNTDDYIGRRTYVLLSLIFINALVLAACYVHPSTVDNVFLQYGFVPAHPHISTVLSSMFLHAGFWHFAGNMFFLWMFGDRVENTFGRWLFGFVYILSGFGAAALHYAFNSGSNIPCVGASGAISGIVGCYIVLFPKSSFDMVIVFLRWPVKTIHTDTYGAVGAWIGEQVILGLLTQAVQFSSVAFWGHIGGFVTGAGVTGLLLLVVPQLRTRGDQRLVVRAVRGTVRDITGKPVSGARFEMHADFHPPVSIITDAKGKFNLTSVHDGSYSFQLTKSPFQPIQGTLVVRRKGRYALALKLTMKVAASDVSAEKVEVTSG